MPTGREHRYERGPWAESLSPEDHAEGDPAANAVVDREQRHDDGRHDDLDDVRGPPCRLVQAPGDEHRGQDEPRSDAHERDRG